MTADIDSLAELVQWGLLQFMAAGLLLVLAIFLLASLSWQLTLIALLVLPVLVISSIKFQRDSNRAYLEVRERVGANLSNLQESIAAVRVIRPMPARKNRFVGSKRPTAICIAVTCTVSA